VDLKAYSKINYGMFIVASVKEGLFNAQIANTVFQVTAEPAQIAVSINKLNLTHEYIKTSGLFSISILSQDASMEFIGKFGFKSGRNTDKFAQTKHRTGHNGLPIVLDHSLATFEAEVVSSLDAGTHTVFIGRIMNCDLISQAEPMTYSYYHLVKKGFSPKTAPTYISNEPKKEDSIMKKYKCTICGYIYDPALGDPDSGIKPGTPFEEIPATWVCPVCGADKNAFEPA